LPVQHGSDRILMAMKRGYTVLEYKSVIRKLRAIRPDLSLSTDMIVGFPGETEEDFAKMMTLIDEMSYDTSFSFIFSPRPGTPAANLHDDTPREVKLKRLQHLQATIEENVARISESMVGKVAFGEMKAFDKDGNPLPPGEIGEVYMRRPEGMPPSYHYRGATARTMEGGWESLGDIGSFDADGYLYLADRRTDMILVGGSNVYPAEIEAALDEHPLVQSSAVIGLPDEEMGATIHAIVQPRPGLTEDALREHLRPLLVTYKQPRTYEFVEDNIRDDSGKVRRTQLRDERIAAMKAGPSP